MSSRRSFIRDLSSIYGLSILATLISTLVIHGSLGQDILFPDQRPPTTHRPIVDQRVAVSPEPEIKCLANMTLIKDTTDNETYCECLAGNLYYSKLDRCFLQYTRGPCKTRRIFVLRENATIAKCVRNPCTKKNTVHFKGSCFPLYVSGGPCEANQTLAVSEISYKPECVDIVTVNYQVITAPIKRCGPGSRRAGMGMCRQIL